MSQPTSKPTSQPRWRTELGATLKLALPLMVGQLSAIGMNVIDVALAGHYSARTLGAVSVGTNVWALAIVTSIGMMLALPPSVAQLSGAGKYEQIGVLFRQSLWLALTIGLALFVAVRNADPLLRAIGTDPTLLDDAHGFLQAISWGAPALTGYFALRGLSEGAHMTRPTMYFGAFGLLLLGPIGYTLMYGAFGFAPRGAQGSGMATAIVLWLQFGAFLSYIMLRKHYRQLAPFARLELPNPRVFGELLRLSVPMGVSLLMECSLFVAAALLISSLGATTVAGHQIAINVASATFMLPLALAMATTVRVGRAVGAGDAEGVRLAGYVGIFASLATQSFSSFLMAAFPQRIAGLLTNDAGVAAIGAQLLVFAAVFQFSDGIQVTANGALRGLKDTTLPMLITTLAYWCVGMPLGWWLGFRANWGASGMWVGLIAGLTVAAALLLARFARLVRRPAKSRAHAAPTSIVPGE